MQWKFQNSFYLRKKDLDESRFFHEKLTSKSVQYIQHFNMPFLINQYYVQ